MAIKIQINSLEALERLIGGDTELELELRKSCVYEFAKRHLKHIGEEEIKLAESEVVKAVQKEANEALLNYGRYISNRLNTKVTREIQQKVQEMVETEVGVNTMEYTSTENLLKLRDAVISKQAFIATRVQKEVDRLVNEEVQARVKLAFNQAMGTIK